MVIRQPLGKPKVEAIDIDKLIDKGAKVKQDNAEKKWTFINVRITSNMLNDVDDLVEHRVGITRTGWILEAIHEKIKREQKENA